MTATSRRRAPPPDRGRPDDGPEPSPSPSRTPSYRPAGRKPLNPFFAMFHPHVVTDGQGGWKCEAGYIPFPVTSIFVDFNCRWAANQPHSDFDHVVSAGTPGQWRPEPGYTWVKRNARFVSETGGVKWTPGRAYPTLANVVSGDDEGIWVPRPGYTWVNPRPSTVEASGGGRWNPGQVHPQFPNVVASIHKDTWRPLPGYTWVDP